MTAFVLRDAVRADVPHVRRLVRGLAEYERLLDKVVATEADFEHLLFGAPPRCHAVLAECADGRVPGIAIFYYTINTFAGRTGLFLEDLFVEQDCRGAGIGRALLRHLAQRALAEDCNIIEWRVLNWNAPSIAFYERLGATPMRDWHVRQLGGAALKALAEGASNG
ncbi:MAG TPA: GNAT family N-acetyltransferase [Acetobacteraceae bacterium]|nr:GNAT family N-acetyltransferase [Acetobacteraceae bacterium]